MKPFKIGEKEYNLIDNIFDMNDERFTVFKQHLLQVFEQIDKPLFAAAFSKYVTAHNASDHVSGVLIWHDFKKAIELKDFNYDAYSLCFCFLCLEPGENQREVSKAFQLKKLEEMRSHGLTRGVVEDTVTNFIKAYPEQFGVYLAMQELMKPQLKEEFLKES